MKKTCYIAAHDVLSEDYFLDLQALVEGKLGWQIVWSLTSKPEVILYAGGVDINPRLYGQKAHILTQTPYPLRDGMETQAWLYSQFQAEHTVWNIGICRGMQFLNVFNGGKLTQHVEGHNDDVTAVTHKIEYFGRNKKDTFGTEVNSYHHQMIEPPLIGKAKNNPYSILCKTAGLLNDPEAILFERTNSIGVQWHPEWSPDGSYNMFRRIIKDYVEAA